MPVTVKMPAGVPDTEVSPAFLEKMVNAMAMAWFNYGAAADAYPHKVDAIQSLKLRLDKYADTGNTDYLVDAANFAMLEFMHPRHPHAHYAAGDSDQSPGRVWHTGHVGQDANTHERQSVRTPKRDGD